MEPMIALLRGINVGGRNRLRMQDLRKLLTGLGCTDVQTYIQSGNVVFRSAVDPTALSRDIESAIEACCGFAPQVMVLTASGFESVIAGNPYADEVADPKTVHVSFLSAEAATADIGTMERECTDNESFYLSRNALYFHAPDGIARSTFAKNVEKRLGVTTTGRNWRTVCKIAELLRSIV